MKKDTGRNQDGTFGKGTTGNPKGRPRKGESFAELFEKHMSRDDLVHHAARLVKKGDRTATINTLDRMFGKPVQEIRVHSDIAIDAPIHLHIGAKIETIEDDEDDHRDEAADEE